MPILGLQGQVHGNTVAILTALALCLRALYKGSLKICNIYLMLILGFLPLSIAYGFQVSLKPYIEIFLYVMMFGALSQENAEKSLDLILWAGFIMSIYGLLQWLGFEQFYIHNFANHGAQQTPSKEVVGFLLNPTYFGAYIAMLIPLTIRQKKWYMTATMLVCVLATKSDMAIGSMIGSLLCLPFLVNARRFAIGCCLALVLFGGLCFGVSQGAVKINDSGRFHQWTKIVAHTFKGQRVYHKPTQKETYKKYNLFGFGGGSFKNMYPLKLTNINFKRAHNDYLQAYWEFGIVITVLFILFIIQCVLRGFDIYTRASIICVCLNALGLFVWQIGAIQLLSVYVLCLNKEKYV